MKAMSSQINSLCADALYSYVYTYVHMYVSRYVMYMYACIMHVCMHVYVYTHLHTYHVLYYWKHQFPVVRLVVFSNTNIDFSEIL